MATNTLTLQQLALQIGLSPEKLSSAIDTIVAALAYIKVPPLLIQVFSSGPLTADATSYYQPLCGAGKFTTALDAASPFLTLPANVQYEFDVDAGPAGSATVELALYDATAAADVTGTKVTIATTATKILLAVTAFTAVAHHCYCFRIKSSATSVSAHVGGMAQFT